jgi:hypothetical protein
MQLKNRIFQFHFKFESVILMVAATARGKEIGGWYRTEKQLKTL